MLSARDSTTDDVLTSAEAGGKVIRGSAVRVIANVAGTVLGLATATLLLRHLGVDDSGRYVTVLSLVGIAVAVVDTGLNVTASNQLALRAPDDRRPLVANILGQRLLAMPLALGAIVAFAALADYPAEMVAGTALAGVGVFIVAAANALLLPLAVELRNAGLAFVDFLRQAVTLVGVAVLVALGSQLTPFFALQIVVGLAVIAVTPLLVGYRRNRPAAVRPGLPDDAVQPRPADRAGARPGTDLLPAGHRPHVADLLRRADWVLRRVAAGDGSSDRDSVPGGRRRATDADGGCAGRPVATALCGGGARRGCGAGGVLAILVVVPLAEPVMEIIGGEAFGPAGAVLRIQVAALMFIALNQIWTVSLIATGQQRQLILANGLGLLGLGVFAAVLVPAFEAEGGAAATVLGDALLAGLIYWRLHRHTGRVMVGAPFLAKVAGAAAIASIPLVVGLPALVAALLAGALFVGVGLVDRHGAQGAARPGHGARPALGPARSRTRLAATAPGAPREPGEPVARQPPPLLVVAGAVVRDQQVLLVSAAKRRALHPAVG